MAPALWIVAGQVIELFKVTYVQELSDLATFDRRPLTAEDFMPYTKAELAECMISVTTGNALTMVGDISAVVIVKKGMQVFALRKVNIGTSVGLMSLDDMMGDDDDEKASCIMALLK